MDKLQSWTDDASTLYYSGTANYERTFNYQPSTNDTKRVFLNFGEGTPLPNPSGRTQGYLALLDSPIREAAIVTINGQVAGSIWHAPYEIEISSRLKPGANTIQVSVSNLAVNAMSGQKQPDYKQLNLRYTDIEFVDYGAGGQHYGHLEGTLEGDRLRGSLRLVNLPPKRPDDVNLPTLRAS